MKTSTVELRQLTIPTTLDDPNATDFIEMIRVRNEVYQEIAGNDDDSVEAAAMLPAFQPDPDQQRTTWVAVVGDEFVGRVAVDLPLEDGSTVAFWLIELLRKVHGQGIGSAGYRLVEEHAVANGRSVLQSYASHPEVAGPRLASPTGFGSIPEDRAARFYARNGYTLEQIERKSVLDLTTCGATVDALFEQARAASSQYEVVQWLLPTPDEHLADYAWMKSRMSTDAPSAAMEFDEEAWDEERVRRADQRLLNGGWQVLVTAARHLDSGRLVAFNELAAPPGADRPTDQHDTLVLKEHRGHKLGLLVKTAGLQRWREVAPQATKVITYNAEENRPMLDINEALGFVPDSYGGGWKKTLAN